MSDTPESAPEETPKVEYSATAGFAQRLAENGCALAFTSYMSNLLYLLGTKSDGGLHIHQTQVQRPMGLCSDGAGKLLLGAGTQIMRFENVLRRGENVNEVYDSCFVPRQIHVTGSLDIHDVGLDGRGIPVFVNTRFNCLATVDPKDSFRTVWKPPFISRIVDEDRCHLNGLAMRDGKLGYVTAVSRSDTVDGWRDRRHDGGIVMDIATGEVVCEGLSMPHSPRMRGDALWLLNAGTGELGRVVRPADGGMGRFEPLCFCPGFLRGLSFVGDYAYVGLSKPRYARFEGLALDDKLRETDSEPWCGVQVIDLRSGRCVDWFRIDGAVSELYDVEIIPGLRTPMAIAPNAEDIDEVITYRERSSALPHAVTSG